MATVKVTVTNSNVGFTSTASYTTIQTVTSTIVAFTTIVQSTTSTEISLTTVVQTTTSTAATSTITVTSSSTVVSPDATTTVTSTATVTSTFVVPTIALANPTPVVGDVMNGSPYNYDDNWFTVNAPYAFPLVFYNVSSTNLRVSINGVSISELNLFIWC